MVLAREGIVVGKTTHRSDEQVKLIGHKGVRAYKIVLILITHIALRTIGEVKEHREVVPVLIVHAV